MSVKNGKASVTPFPASACQAGLAWGHRWFLKSAFGLERGKMPRRELFVMRDGAKPDQAVQLTDLPETGQMARVMCSPSVHSRRLGTGSNHRLARDAP